MSLIAAIAYLARWPGRRCLTSSPTRMEAHCDHSLQSAARWAGAGHPARGPVLHYARGLHTGPRGPDRGLAGRERRYSARHPRHPTEPRPRVAPGPALVDPGMGHSSPTMSVQAVANGGFLREAGGRCRRKAGIAIAPAPADDDVAAQPAHYFGTQRAWWPHTCPTPQSQSFSQPFGCSGGASTM